MKFIFFNRFFAPDVSATSQLLSDLAFHLASKGEEVVVVTSRGLYDDASADLPAWEMSNGVTVHRVYRSRFGRHSIWGRALDAAALYYHFVAAALRLAARGDSLVVMTDPPLLSVALALVARLKSCHLVNWLQDVYPEVALGLGVRLPAPFGALLAGARNLSLKFAARNVAIGERMAARLRASGLPPERVAIIPNWCDDERVIPRPIDDNALRAEWGASERFVVAYSGNLGRAHEYRTLLDAAERLRDEADLLFLFIGGGYLTRGLRAEVETRGLSSLFQFRPYQDAELLPLSLTAANVHWISLLPSMEGLIVPSKFYGVAAAGRGAIVIGDPEGEIAALVTRHDCGAAVASGEGTDLAALIRRLKRDPAMVAQWGRNARALLDGEFGRRRSLLEWETLLASLRGRQFDDAELAAAREEIGEVEPVFARVPGE
ncbi:glycosyltransferase family 4 protein [Methylosinus sp. H3A]|uniref:glycosyltransferase family 4 protein n=1 Tax=Methylosinus sp. H3A TaxID=2785786 RepID=UPI0018C25739|nr:glycosyltransferase family 4 protein [Methylosinus sp. H3A]MBG0811734.1 glycosyltransferase family 4 protein [Methylosinus sp. H3A]